MPFRKSTTPLPEPELFDYALRALTRRMRSERDLRRLLTARTDPADPGAPEVVDRILHRLRDLRYLSDERFAADYTRLRQENQYLGQRRVGQDLQTRGIPKDLITETLTRAYAETDELTLAQQFCQRKRISPPTTQKETNRLLGRLLRAGFSTPTIWKLLRSWNTPLEEEPNDLADDLT